MAAALLGVVFVGQMWMASGIKSPTSDERPHIAGGLSYLANGKIELNPEHPPLLKEISAVFLHLGGIRFPGEWRAIPQDPDFEWTAGDRIIVQNGPDEVMFWARLPMMVLSASIGVILYFWGRQTLGNTASVCAVFLFAFDPILLANSYLVTMDCGLAALTLLFFFLLWNLTARPDWRRLMCCGVALGAALSSKFSGIALLPAAAMLMAARLRWAPEEVRLASPNDPISPAAGGGQGILRMQSWKGALTALVLLSGIAVLVIEAVYLFDADPFLYVKNYSKVYPTENPNYLHFLGGQFARHFYSYLTVAYLLKEPLPAILLALAGLAILFRDRSMPVLLKLYLTIPPVLFWFVHTVKAKNTGVRYLIPALPFCFLLGGLALSRMLKSGSRWKRGTAVILMVWLLVTAVGIYPDHLAFFNEMACVVGDPGKISWDGGTRCGTLWLDDSNVDWGQGMKQLQAWLEQNGGASPVYLANFAGIPPESYGIRYQAIDFSRDLILPRQGWYVISAHYMARVLAQLPQDGQYGSWIRGKPAAVVGRSYYIYDLH